MFRRQFSALGSYSLSFCFAGEKLELKDQKDKESYSLGYQFGQSLKAQGVDINLEVYTSGIQDALGGTKPFLSQEEILKTVSDLQQRVMAARQKELKEMAEKNLSEGKAFLEENKKKEGVKTLPSGLQYKVLSGRVRQNTQSRPTRSRLTTGARSLTAPSSIAPIREGTRQPFRWIMSFAAGRKLFS